MRGWGPEIGREGGGREREEDREREDRKRVREKGREKALAEGGCQNKLFVCCPAFSMVMEGRGGGGRGTNKRI
jgi:hypothetical protein